MYDGSPSANSCQQWIPMKSRAELNFPGHPSFLLLLLEELKVRAHVINIKSASVVINPMAVWGSKRSGGNEDS
jgi:hypothetical protein